MKFKVTMKDPDGPVESINEAAEDSVANEVHGLEQDELEPVVERRVEKLREFAGRWLKYGEYVELEFDTEAETCTVKPVRS